MIPQPQPASYWIELLEELTGIVSTKHSFQDRLFSTLHDWMYSNWNIADYKDDYVDAMFLEADYITSGQNVIDAAVEYHLRHDEPYSEEIFELIKNMKYQTTLYLRCNGIKR